MTIETIETVVETVAVAVDDSSATIVSYRAAIAAMCDADKTGSYRASDFIREGTRVVMLGERTFDGVAGGVATAYGATTLTGKALTAGKYHAGLRKGVGRTGDTLQFLADRLETVKFATENRDVAGVPAVIAAFLANDTTAMRALKMNVTTTGKVAGAAFHKAIAACVAAVAVADAPVADAPVADAPVADAPVVVVAPIARSLAETGLMFVTAYDAASDAERESCAHVIGMLIESMKRPVAVAPMAARA